MGCIICNMMHLSHAHDQLEKEGHISQMIAAEIEETENEMANDIAINHPRMVHEINRIYYARQKREDNQYNGLL